MATNPTRTPGRRRALGAAECGQYRPARLLLRAPPKPVPSHPGPAPPPAPPPGPLGPGARPGHSGDRPTCGPTVAPAAPPAPPTPPGQLCRDERPEQGGSRGQTCEPGALCLGSAPARLPAPRTVPAGPSGDAGLVPGWRAPLVLARGRHELQTSPKGDSVRGARPGGGEVHPRKGRGLPGAGPPAGSYPASPARRASRPPGASRDPHPRGEPSQGVGGPAPVKVVPVPVSPGSVGGGWRPHTRTLQVLK